MDTKTLKSNLKKAKEAIKNKEINVALSLCKAVLKEDRNNYIALVLLGAALQESEQKDQAPNAFRKAIEISPDQILAWQGLAAFYEKDCIEKNAENLVPIYQQLLLLESESSKWCEIVSKLQATITKFKCNEFMHQIVVAHKSTGDNAKVDALRKLLVHYLSHVSDIPEDHLRTYEEVLNSSETSDSVDYQVYLKLLYNQRKTRELLEACEKLYKNTQQEVHIAEWVCKVCSEEFVDDRASVVTWCSKLPQYYDVLLGANSGSVLGLMAQGAHLMSQCAYLEARQCLQHCLSESGGLFHAMCMLAETHVHLLCFNEALQCAQDARTLRPEHVMPKALLVKSLALTEEPANWERAISLASEILAEQTNELAVEGLCQAKYNLGQWADLQSALGKLSHAPALADLLRLEVEARASGDQALLTSLAQDTPTCPEAWYRLGQCYLAAESPDLACTAFLKCAKLAPHWYTAYLELGHLYSRVPSTLDKARRCYQRALVLRPHHRSTQMALSDVYRALGDMKSNLELLEGICQHVEGRWAWPRLGLQYSDLGDTTAAINCLQSALKSNPDDSHMWEALADAYLARGANGSALRSYQKVLELNPGAFYPALQIATIKQITDLPEESLVEFRELVEQQPNSILALKGLCETCICLAKDFLAGRLLGRVRDRLQEGLTAVSAALEIKPGLACLWKLAGDCLTMAGSLPRSWSCLEVSVGLCPKAGGPQTLQGMQVLELGARCLCRCLKLMPEAKGVALVWHDLALNYLRQIWLGGKNAAVCQKALAAAKQSVTLDPRKWQHWNILGVVATLPDVKAYAKAQHAFIKATTVDDTVAVPWSNLGCLYLSLGELKLANASFSAAQRIDSEYCPSWVGQALIAERVNNEETMDLFRHTTQLGYHVESCVGYAQWVCHTLQRTDAQHRNDPHYVYSIERMHAVPVAIDCLTWATEELEEACGLNMLGCLLECAGLYSLSVAALSRAVDHSPDSHKDKVLANFARVLLKAGKVDDAIQVYKAIAKADIHSQCGLALALYKGKEYQEAYNAYDAALNWWAANDVDKAHLHTAIAAVTYKLAGPEKAKALLLEGNQLKPVSVYSLFASCALGMLNRDLDLSKMVLKELLKYQDNLEYATDVSLFQAYTKFIEGEPEASVHSMSEAVHRQPHLAAHWLHLALLILNKQSLSADPPGKVAVAAQCALTAMALGRSNMDVSKVLAVASLSYLLGGKIKEALTTSQQAVHLYPTVGECWAVLAASCYLTQTQAPLRALISRARQHTDLERPLAKWMSNFERKIALIES